MVRRVRNDYVTVFQEYAVICQFFCKKSFPVFKKYKTYIDSGHMNVKYANYMQNISCKTVLIDLQFKRKA